MRLLLVEDELFLAERLGAGLREESYAVDLASSCEEASRLVEANDYDLVILDLLLPDGSGLDLLVTWRRSGLDAPVLVLTALDAVPEKVRGLESGADDYLTKPFAFEELLARVASLLRRRKLPQQESLTFGDLTLERSQRRAWRGGEELELTAKEFALLEYFMLHPGVVVDRVAIAEHVWDSSYEARSNVIDVILSRLRRKLESGSRSRLIHTLVGSGYVLRQTATADRTRAVSEP